MKKAFRIYNRRTRRIIETIYVDFDELTAMASEHNSSRPALHEMTPVSISLGLGQNPPSSTPFVPPSRSRLGFICFNQCLLSPLIEPKNYKEALTQACWIEAKQRNFMKFERLKFGNLFLLLTKHLSYLYGSIRNGCISPKDENKPKTTKPENGMEKRVKSKINQGQKCQTPNAQEASNYYDTGRISVVTFWEGGIYLYSKGHSAITYRVSTQVSIVYDSNSCLAIRGGARSIVLGEREEDSFLMINLSRKVVEYNLTSKTLCEIYDMGSNQVVDDYLDGFIPSSARTMAGVDVDTLTMEQYLALSRENQAPGVVKPKIGGNVNFEIKSQFMRELREDTFSGNKDEDAHDQIDRVLSIIGLFNIPGVSKDAIML
ncbi:hypothetical protein Tco_1419290 [Tanacetum coccineum]